MKEITFIEKLRQIKSAEFLLCFSPESFMSRNLEILTYNFYVVLYGHGTHSHPMGGMVSFFQ